MICKNMLLSLYHLTTFTFTQLPNWFLTSSWNCVRQRLQKGKVFTTLIFCLLESLIYLPISLSLLETGQRNSRFLFLLSKLEKGIQVSLSPLETGQENSRFLFLLSRRGKGIWISLSPLKCGEIVFKFLFLFSIGLFCISSMTAAWGKPKAGKLVLGKTNKSGLIELPAEQSESWNCSNVFQEMQFCT